MSRIQRMTLIFAASSMVLTSPLLAANAFAATSKAKAISTKPAPGHVRAEVDGHAIAAISVGTETYVEWQALSVFKSPHQYLGDGKFAVTGGTVQGVIYQGNTYLPWKSVAAKVKSTPLRGGGFNFTSLAVKHDYHIELDTQDTPSGSPAPVQVILYDGNNSVPNQKIDVTTTGSSWITGSTGANLLTVTADSSGTWLGGIDDAAVEPVTTAVSWLDPSGTTVRQTASINFGTPIDTATTVAPADETVVTTTPTSTFENAIEFNAKSGNNNVLLQLDTGAFEPLFTKADADLLNLPNLGSIQVAGIGGQDTAYISKVSLVIGGVQFNDVPCIVDENYTGLSLFGYGFFIDNGYDVLVSQKHSTITFLK